MAFRGLNNEADLLTLISLGDEGAFRKIFDFYGRRLNSYVLRITDNEEMAEEIVMDAFLKIWVNRADLQNIQNFDAYLYTLVRNRAFNAIKRIAKESEIIKELSHTNTEYQECTEETVIYKDYKHLLDEALNKLPPQQRLAYTLSRNEGLKYDEIATALNLSKNTVKAHLKKAVGTLRVVFSNYLMLTYLICFYS